MPFPEPDPRRVATSAFSGYVYQCYLGVERWLRLEDDEVLLCEGHEDLDVYLLGEAEGDDDLFEREHRAAELVQVKEMGEIQANVVREVLAHFAVSFRQLDGHADERRFRLVTTAPPKEARAGTLLEFLNVWEDPEEIERIKTGARELFEGISSNGLREAALGAAGWMDDADGRWEAFRQAVAWSFGQPRTEAVREGIVEALGQRDDASHLTSPLREVLVDRLLRDMVDAHRTKNRTARQRTKADLATKIQQLRNGLEDWRSDPALHRLHDLRTLGQTLLPGTLARQEIPAEGLSSWGRLLTAAYEIVPFDTEGRAGELAFLDESCRSDVRMDVLLIHGQGGVGKTRLMIEACRRLREQGWLAGFLPSSWDGVVEPLFDGERGRLVVMDYAETQLPRLKDLLATMAERKDAPGAKLRLVLLSRNADDWWQNLPRELGVGVEDLLHRGTGAARECEVVKLTVPGERREQLFEDAAGAFGKHLGVPKSADGRPGLADELFGRPLYLHMAAVAWLHGTTVATPADALDRALRHEETFWNRQAEDEAERQSVSEDDLKEALPQAMAALTLVGGAGTKTEARELFEGLGLEKAIAKVVIRLLRRLYPVKDVEEEEDRKFLGPLTPDLLGEELVAQVLGGEPEVLDQLLDGLDEVHVEQALTVLTRLAQRDPVRGELLIRRALAGRIDQLAHPAFIALLGVGDPLGSILAEQMRSACHETIDWFVERIELPQHQFMVTLRELAAAATELFIQRIRSHEWPHKEPRLAKLASKLNNLGIYYHALNRSNDALRVANEATQIYRSLAAQHPETFKFKLSRTLNNLGVRYHALDQPHEALRVTEEAVQIRRGLATQDAAFLPDLAMSLNNLGVRYNALDRPEEALRVTQESVEIRRELADLNPNDLNPDLAKSLSNLGYRLNALGRHAEALAALEECLEIRSQLALQRPAVYKHLMANTLAELSSSYFGLGRYTAAVASITESIRTLTPDFLKRPRAFGEKMLGKIAKYESITMATGTKIDPALLAPLADELAKLGWTPPDDPSDP